MANTTVAMVYGVGDTVGVLVRVGVCVSTGGTVRVSVGLNGLTGWNGSESPFLHETIPTAIMAPIVTVRITSFITVILSSCFPKSRDPLSQLVGALKPESVLLATPAKL